MAEKWESSLDELDLDEEDFFDEAIYELWKRHLHNVGHAEILCRSFEEIIDYYETIHHHNRSTLLSIYEKLSRIYHEFIKEGGNPDFDLSVETVGSSFYDIEGLLLEFPF